VILDSSALVAILLAEPDHPHLVRKLEDADELGIGTPTLLETAMVLCGRTGQDQRDRLEAFLRRCGAVEIPFTPAHWREAHAAFWRYGKGRHPAGLNFGDCCSYAVARIAGRPLLCKGEDFPKTDLRLA
jgi:ribonuclease VapC